MPLVSVQKNGGSSVANEEKSPRWFSVIRLKGTKLNGKRKSNKPLNLKF